MSIKQRLIEVISSFPDNEEATVIFIYHTENERTVVFDGKVMGSLLIEALKDEELRLMIIAAGKILADDAKVEEVRKLLNEE